MNTKNPQNYTYLAQQLTETLRSLENPELEIDALAQQLEKGYELLEALQKKLTEAEVQVEKVIQMHTKS